MNELESIKSLIGIDEDSHLSSIFDVLSEQAPVIGRVLTSYKIHRLSKRLKASEAKLNELEFKVNQIDDEEFLGVIKNFVFPIVLQQLLDEDEDNKIGLVLEGFGSILDEETIKESKFLIFYDLLKQLRFIEIEYLFTFSQCDNRPYEELEYFRSGEFEDIKYVVENKLQRLGLLSIPNLSGDDVRGILNSSLRAEERGMPVPPTIELINITSIGEELLTFVKFAERGE